MKKPEEHPSRQWVIDAIKQRWSPAGGAEEVPLAKALGRVSAKDYAARHNQPVYRASAMDGVAVKSALFADGTPDASGWRLGAEYIRADTGDDFDDAFDAVIPVEKVTFLVGGGLSLDLGVCPRGHGGPGGPGGPGAKLSDANCDEGCTGRPDCDKKPQMLLEAGFNVRPCGSGIKEGEHAVGASTVLTALDLAALAACGVAQVEVRRRPKVAFIPTGSELVELGRAPERGQTIDSNSVMVAAMLDEMGAEAMMLPIVRDSRTELAEALDKALAAADIVILNAGSSKGGEDYNAALLAERGESVCHWVAAAPGRPFAAAIIEGKPVLNIPGPPMATYYVMDWCTRPLVAHALGVAPAAKPTVEAVLTADVGHPPFMQILNRLEVRRDEDAATGFIAEPRGMLKSTQLAALTASAQFVNPLGEPGQPHAKHPSGSTLRVELLRNAAYL
jgi:molybdopterin molybdotransferase/putative molybdopterin biosynthesis protein